MPKGKWIRHNSSGYKSDSVREESQGVCTNTAKLEIIQTDIELIKKDLKQKVDYDDFAALEDRVRQLETKARR